MTAHAANPGRHSLADRGDDFYETPAEAVLALLKAEGLPTSVWEPACGAGAIVRVLRESGVRVHATDLVDRGCPASESGIDFLLAQRAPDGVEAIVTNPPYKLADQFVAHALRLVPHVVMLLRLAFLESERRSSTFGFRESRTRSRFQKQTPNDASARLDRAARDQLDSVCVVLLGSQSRWPDHCRPYFSEGSSAMTHDRASIFARTLLQTIARYIVDEPNDAVPLHARIAEQLRDEFADVARHTVNEIRLSDE